MSSLLSSALQFLRENDFKTILRRLASRDTHPFIQFIKYGFCGVAATVMHQGIFWTLGYTVLPSIDGMIVNGQPITDELRSHNGTLNNIIAFFPVVIFVYILNMKWVFTPGRHSPLVEFLLFAGVAAIGNTAGILGGPMLIRWFGISTLMSQGSFIITSFLVNFLCRKFIIFKG